MNIPFAGSAKNNYPLTLTNPRQLLKPIGVNSRKLVAERCTTHP
jgi:hypothetical protein